jgi:hypothetical protein
VVPNICYVSNRVGESILASRWIRCWGFECHRQFHFYLRQNHVGQRCSGNQYCRTMQSIEYILCRRVCGRCIFRPQHDHRQLDFRKGHNGLSSVELGKLIFPTQPCESHASTFCKLVVLLRVCHGVGPRCHGHNVYDWYCASDEKGTAATTSKH